MNSLSPVICQYCQVAYAMLALICSSVEPQITCDRRMNICEVGEHEDFGVVEDVAQITEARQSLGSNAIAAIMGWSADAQLIDVVTNSQLRLVVSLNDDI